MATRKRKFKPKAIKRRRGPVVWRKDPNKLLLADASVIFSKVPVPIAPGFDFHKQVHAHLTAARKGDASKPKMEARRNATDAKYTPLKIALERTGVDLSTERNFDAGRREYIKNKMLKSGVKPFATISDPEKAVKSLIRWLKSRTTYVCR